MSFQERVVAFLTDNIVATTIGVICISILLLGDSKVADLLALSVVCYVGGINFCDLAYKKGIERKRAAEDKERFEKARLRHAQLTNELKRRTRLRWWSRIFR